MGESGADGGEGGIPRKRRNRRMPATGVARAAGTLVVVRNASPWLSRDSTLGTTIQSLLGKGSTFFLKTMQIASTFFLLPLVSPAIPYIIIINSMTFSYVSASCIARDGEAWLQRISAKPGEKKKRDDTYQ